MIRPHRGSTPSPSTTPFRSWRRERREPIRGDRDRGDRDGWGSAGWDPDRHHDCRWGGNLHELGDHRHGGGADGGLPRGRAGGGDGWGGHGRRGGRGAAGADDATLHPRPGRAGERRGGGEGRTRWVAEDVEK